MNIKIVWEVFSDRFKRLRRWDKNRKVFIELEALWSEWLDAAGENSSVDEFMVMARGAILKKKEHVLAEKKFISQFEVFVNASKAFDRNMPISWTDRQPCFGDDSGQTGFDRHYIYHPAWAARVLARNRPELHVDISSSLHFCSLVSAFVPIYFYDFRPANIDLSNLYSGQVDLTKMHFENDVFNSLSCMHVLEHVGLGRYGDPLDPEGDRKAIAELVRVLAPGGRLLIAVPIGRPRTMFNAHRVYDAKQFCSEFVGLILEEFTLISDAGGGLITEPNDELLQSQEYGCGCFVFSKPL